MKTRNNRILILLLFFLCFFGLHTGKAGTKHLLMPFVKNFSKLEYHGANQNWDVCQGINGEMYFANSDGLLEYDGASWKLYPLPAGQLVRSVTVDSAGRVYVGAHEEFGYWKKNKQGQLEYFSLIDLVEVHQLRNQDIWKICVWNGKVYFQSFAEIYVYDGEKLTTINTPANVFSLFKIRDRLLVSIQHMGLYEFQQDSLVALKGTNQLAPKTINIAIPYGEKGILLGTELGGLYRYEDEQMTPWKNDADEFLKNFQLNKAATVSINDKEYYLFGTITQGLVVLDKNGGIYSHITKGHGLQNNTILGIKVDQYNNLWLSLDNGIDFINLNSSFRYYHDRSGELGTVYSAAIFNEKLYLGTNHGLYSAVWDANLLQLKTDFSLVKNTQGQVWNLKVVDDVLFCGHNNGTFLISAKGIKRISNVSGGWILKEVPGKSDMLIQGTYIGLVIYKKSGGVWRMSHMVRSYHEPTEFLEFDYKGNLWTSHAYKGLYKLTLNSDLSAVLKSEYYNKENGLPDDANINVFKVDQQVVFTTKGELFSYDYNQEKLASFTKLNDGLKDFKDAHKIISIDNRNYWFFKKGKCARVLMDHGEIQSIDALSFQLLRGSTLDGYENIIGLGRGDYLICQDAGFSIFSSHQTDKALSLHNHKVMLRKITCNSQTSKLHEALDLDGGSEIANSKNNMSFEFALPVYRFAKLNYQWKLEDYDVFWSDPSDRTLVDYSKLPHGKYTFKVRATDSYGSVSKIASYSFTILPPWYLSRLAKIIYWILFFALIGGFRVVYYYKLDKQKRKYYLKLQEENEEKIIKLKNDHLREEIENKSKELANYTMMVTKKNELLNQLKEELDKLGAYVIAAAAKKRVAAINKLIQRGISSEDEWKVFNENFDKANEIFLQSLKADFPELTPNDLRFCALLRMNMTSKEIANLLNLSPRSVEVKRYRLRKKLNLEHEENLVEFLMGMKKE
ncbi:helix-turn-helix and ligand-binding sensor domain-containing protein [Marinifilum sp. D737]|uniref:helix-turn-helix and ligand-binding sensor domain-containing protein n=1 Tax=Marinifilum sp. D737 TaxID=2969628 RepID=UPI0022733467|nr:triple tyrosine motif-containing protein [Marinifilum sp. D737]MCY1633751.1 LuxR C-terminal-related transcriptional regulator [Marinifilum sp. D737]